MYSALTSSSSPPPPRNAAARDLSRAVQQQGHLCTLVYLSLEHQHRKSLFSYRRRNVFPSPSPLPSPSSSFIAPSIASNPLLPPLDSSPCSHSQSSLRELDRIPHHTWSGLELRKGIDKKGIGLAYSWKANGSSPRHSPPCAVPFQRRWGC